MRVDLSKIKRRNEEIAIRKSNKGCTVECWIALEDLGSRLIGIATNVAGLGERRVGDVELT